MQIEDSDAEEEENSGMDREAIANQLFDGDDVSIGIFNLKKIDSNQIIMCSFVLFSYD